MKLKSHCKVIGIVAILLILSNTLLNAHNHSNKTLFSENAIGTPEISSSSTTNELCGDGSTVILSIQNPVAGEQYRWFKDDVALDGKGNEALRVLETGTYKLQVIVDVDTSDFSNVIDITMNPDKEFPKPTLSIDSKNGQLCGEGSSALLHIQNNSSYHDATYSWLISGETVGTSTLPSYWVTETGLYAAMVEQEGCFRMSLFVEVASNEKTIVIPEIDFTKSTFCGENLRLSVSNTKNYTDPTYQWYRENEIIPDAVTSEYFTQTAGNFKVLVIDDECAVFSEEVDVKVIRNALATDIEVSNDTICIGEPVNLEISNPITGATYTWYSSNNPTPTTIIATGGVLATGALSSDTTFYVSVRHDTLCENTAGNLKAVHISVNIEKQFSLTTIDTLITLPYGVCNTFIEIVPRLKFNSGIGISNIQILNDAPANLIFAKGKHKITWIAKAECGFIDTAMQWVVVNMPVCGELDTIWHLNPVNGEEPFYELQSLKAVDYENNEYPTVRVDCECWTAENLRSTVYSDGSSVENPQAYYAQMYPDTEANKNRYGLLYNWKDATNNVAIHDGKMQGVCPDGWYLPSAEQFEVLIPHGSSALQKPDLWIKNDHITNSAGLSIVPAGFYNSPINRFDFLRGDAFFWSSISINETTSYGVHFQCLCPELRINQYPINHGFSVRCVKE